MNMNGTLSLNGTWGLTYTEGNPLVPLKVMRSPTTRLAFV